MSGPKSVRYTPTAAELARRREAMALSRATSRFRVLTADLEALRVVAAETGTEFGENVAVPAKPALRAGTATEVEAQNAALERMLDETRRGIHSAQQQSVTERFRQYLSGLDELEVPPSKPASRRVTTSRGGSADRPTSEPTLARADRYLASLSPAAELSEHAVQLAAALATATPELAALAVRDLQAEIGRINREAKQRAAMADRLREVDVRAGALGHPELLREVLFARGEPGGITEERLAVLEHRLAAEEASAAVVHARNAARAAMERALLAEGYEVLEGFETAVPQDGVLVRKPGLDYHAWRVAVDDDSIHLTVVRTAHEADPGITTTRDVEAETNMCADLPAVLGRVAEAGVEIGRVRRLEPGDVPVKALPNATPTRLDAASAQAPKERSL